MNRGIGRIGKKFPLHSQYYSFSYHRTQYRYLSDIRVCVKKYILYVYAVINQPSPPQTKTPYESSKGRMCNSKYNLSPREFYGPEYTIINNTLYPQHDGSSNHQSRSIHSILIGSVGQQSKHNIANCNQY